jgi:hypothetical protein
VERPALELPGLESLPSKYVGTFPDADELRAELAHQGV